MMGPLDTGMCAPETIATLHWQQSQLLRGKRIVQMFAIGTSELPLPEGFKRHQNFRGVFHYNPKMLSPDKIDLLGLTGSENIILNLGPYNKSDISERALQGEPVTCISEFAQDGTEIRCAAATTSTLREQFAYFEQTKEPDSLIKVGVLPQRVLDRK